MSFSPGSLVKARGREWVVLPHLEDDDQILHLRPLGGAEDEVTGIYLPLEPVESATFSLPDPAFDLGNHRSCSLLRDALRLGFRSAAGPFRSFARIAVEPRPYQLVPLLMALRLDPVRLLIADDVGIGKTVEACLIARELLDRGEIRRFAVLCPLHLAKQWQKDLREQFHIDAALVLSNTAARLERDCRPGESVFEKYPFVIVAMDYIKSERRRDEFLRTCPELVIVDEAHGCAEGTGRSASQMRHRLLRDLVQDDSRHMILVTATPHSGKEETFRSLLSLLRPSFAELPEDLSGDENRTHREALARHLVQRRRPDLRQYLDTNTPFPDREIAEIHYSLSNEYRQFLDKVIDFCRESVAEDEAIDQRRQRVRWWSALALLRSIGSSPAAAAATLRNRAASAEAQTVDEADELGQRSVLDLDDESLEGIDVTPGSQEELEDNSLNRRLSSFARQAEALATNKDKKLGKATEILTNLIDEGYSPIVFCRFIPTVDYLAAELRKSLSDNVFVEAVTGNLPPEDREKRIDELAQHPTRILVCTDCLSEGINLQEHFDAVVHYDLSWNPTRHEQRDGRVDRYGQTRSTVRTVTLYGRDNPIDGVVLDVLLRKHQSIRQQLGISVPVPLDSNAVLEAVMEGFLLRKDSPRDQLRLELTESKVDEVAIQWDKAAERERRSRTIFAQRSIKVDEVARELSAIRTKLGDAEVVRRFVMESLSEAGATISGIDPIKVNLREAAPLVREAVGVTEFEAVFGNSHMTTKNRLIRTHPIVEALAKYVLEGALDPVLDGPAGRCGLFRTNAVDVRTTVLLLRMRFQIQTTDNTGVARSVLAEDQTVVGFTGRNDDLQWLDNDSLEKILQSPPVANVPPEQAQSQLKALINDFSQLDDALSNFADARANDLLGAHRRVRQTAGLRVRSLRVEPHLPVDVVGIFSYLPVPGSS